MPVNRQTSPVGPNPNGESQPTGTPSGYISPKFDVFTSAGTFKHVLSSYRQITDLLQLTPAPINHFYPKLKAKLDTWKARNLWAKLDKRAAQKEYQKGRACENTRVLIIGAGPVGLRTAIEAQLLGAKVVLIEKRDRFSRNNVLHLWPFVISDLRQLGAKKFFGKFCAGSIDHISIRQLQLILLKVCLLLGVEIHENVTFEGLVEPAEIDGVKSGWRALLSPSDHEASNYEFDFLVCADGKRNTIQGFSRNEFRGKLAIGITANFINRQTQEENKVPEISGVTFIFNQKFFRDMQAATGIDLENIVYYKDDTHYFVMTAKKQSLIERRVIINDYGDVANLLKPENVNNAALLEYATDAARFATKNQLPNLEFAVNHFGRPDVAMFDFTSMFASENASRMVERQGKKLLLCLVGDSLLEPFWPTGSGCARGFLSALDTAWMMKAWETQPPVKVIAERESIYRLLNQTKPENINKDFNHYTINPASRYMNLGEAKVLPGEVTHLCDMETMTFDIPDTEMQMTSMARKRIRNRSIVNPDSLQLWCEKQLYQYNIRVDDMTTCWRDGRALTAILHRYRPELIDHPNEINPNDVAANCQRVFELFEREYGIPPVMTGADMEASEVPDKLTMVSYLTQVYEIFRGAIPRTGRPVYRIADMLEDHESSRPIVPRPNLRAAVEEYRGSRTMRDGRSKSVYDEPNLATNESFTPDAAKRSKLTERAHRSRVHLEAMMRGHGGVRSDMVTPQLERVVDTMDKRAFSARKERIQEQFKLDSTGQRPVSEQPGHSQVATRKSLAAQRPSVRELQKQLLELEKGQVKKDGPPGHLVGKIGKDDWNVRLLEERLKDKEKGTKTEKKKVEKSQVLEELFRDKRSQMEGRLRGEAPERAKYGVIDEQLQRVERQLKDGGAIMDAGERGRNKVAQLKNILDVKAQQNRPLHRLNPPKVNKYLRKEHNKDHDTSGSSSATSYEDLPGSSSGGSCELEIAAFRSKTPPVEAEPDVDADVCVRSQSPPVQESSDLCYFCGQRVYLIDRLSAEGHFFHRSCLRCEYCNENLRIGSYAYDTSGVCKGKFFCVAHFRMERPSERWSQMMRRKEAFLQEEPRPAQILPKKEEPKKEELPKSSTPIRMTPDHTLRPGISSSLIDINRDRTPERAEFENLGDASELDQDDLLNSELEEEELTQRNLGATEVQTDDDIENLSTDEDEDEMMVQVAVQVGDDEQLHRSLTADATRHLAETWSKKHNQSCCDSSETTDEESSTEKDEGATTDDVDSDYEYASDSHPSQAGASQSLKGDTDSKSAGTHDEISDGTEGDYSTIRRKKPAGVPKVSPLVIDSSKKLRDNECQELDEEEAEDEGNSTEDLLTLSITDSSGEEEGPYDEDPKSPQQVPEIVVDEETAPQKSGDELWGEHGIREVLSLTGCSVDGPAHSRAGSERVGVAGTVLSPSDIQSPPDDGSSPGAAMSASLTEVTEFGAELSSDLREESDNKDNLSRRSNESKESKDSHRSNPRVPPRASCDQIKGNQADTSDRQAPSPREEKTEDEISESSVTNTLDAQPPVEPLNMFDRPNSLLRSESDTQMVSVNEDKEPSPVSPLSAPSASIASPDNESISRLDDDFPVVKMTNDGVAPVATLETSDEEDLTVSEWAKEGSEHLSTVEDLNMQQKLQPLSGIGKLKKGYTFHLSGSRADQRESEERDRTPTNSMDELNVNTAPRKPLAQTLSSGDPQPKNHITFLDNYRTLPFKTHSSLLGNPLERSSSANRIDEAAKKAAEKKSPPPKFSGYGGSFAEKVRRPTESDSIYLKSLNIKLKKVDFPSIRSANSSQKGSQDDLLSDEESDSVFRRPAELQKSATSPSVLDHNKNLHATLSAAKPKRTDDLGLSPGRISQVSQVLARDPVAALTQLKAANEASVYENVNNLPYFDDRASLASFKIDTNNPSIEGGFITPTCDLPNKGQAAKDAWRFRTGSVSSVCSIDRERARQEARERAKMKSDAELGISPPSAYLRRHRGRLGSEDGSWETPQRGAHPRPQSEYIERIPDPDLLPTTFRASSQKPVIDSTRQTTSKSNKTPAIASAKKRLFSSGENSPPKTAAPPSRPSSAGNKAKNALFSLLNFGSKNSSGGSSSASPDNKANGGDAKPSTSNQGQHKSGLSKSPSSKTILSSKLKILSPKTSKSPRGSVTSVDSRDTVDSRGMKKNVSLDSLKSSGASPSVANAGNANSTRGTANTSKASSEFSVDLSAMSGSIHEMRLGSMGMSTLISGTDLLCESDDNEPFPDMQDILSDKRVEADKAEKFQQRVYKQQELKRIRIAQEVQRKLEEIEVARAGIEARGVDVEKELRRCAVAAEKEALSQELFQLMRQKNKLNRQEQELLIRAKDLELENRHAKLQKEMRDRMAMEDSKKSPKDVEDERVILREMLEILEKRDKLVVLLDQLELKQQREEREIENRMRAAQQQGVPIANTISASNV